MKKFLVSGSIAFALGPTMWAWEADVHYGLTRWLAIQAGFTPVSAERIAAGDLSADQGSYQPATWAVGFHVLLLGDRSASRSVQKLHFPSYGAVPGPPSQRAVDQKSGRALDWLKKDTQFVTSSVNELSELEDFGQALHSLQDSWSHEGEPDVPFRCFGLMPRSTLTWAHPVNRGGWAFHNADLTYLWKSDARNRPIDMARATFEAMVEYAHSHQDLLARHAADWSTLEPMVKRFIAADTKVGKKKWFESDPNIPFSSYGNPNFIDDLSLPRSSLGAFQMVQLTCNAAADLAGEISRVPGQVPRAIREFFDDFFKRWLVDRKISALVKDMVDVKEVGQELQGFGMAERAPEWTSKFLTMWLLQDHGFVNWNGHGVPNTPGFARLPLDPESSRETPQRRPYKSLDEVMIARGTGSPYTVEVVNWPLA